MLKDIGNLTKLSTHRGKKNRTSIFLRDNSMMRVQPNLGQVFASLDNTLYNDYLRSVASKKLQIYMEKSQMSTRKIEKIINSLLRTMY